MQRGLGRPKFVQR